MRDREMRDRQRRAFGQEGTAAVPPCLVPGVACVAFCEGRQAQGKGVQGVPRQHTNARHKNGKCSVQGRQHKLSPCPSILQTPSILDPLSCLHCLGIGVMPMPPVPVCRLSPTAQQCSVWGMSPPHHHAVNHYTCNVSWHVIWKGGREKVREYV